MRNLSLSLEKNVTDTINETDGEDGMGTEPADIGEPQSTLDDFTDVALREG